MSMVILHNEEIPEPIRVRFATVMHDGLKHAIDKDHKASAELAFAAGWIAAMEAIAADPRTD